MYLTLPMSEPPNVDTAIEDKIKDRQKATLQATRVIHACRMESLFFLLTNWTTSYYHMNYASSLNGFRWDEWKWRELVPANFLS